MFSIPDRPALVELDYVGDRIGSNGVGEIEDIQPNRVVMSYRVDSKLESSRTQLLLRDPIELAALGVDFVSSED